MANILLLDDSEVARSAMRGILGRSRHRCVFAAKVGEALDMLRELVVIDLVFVEVRLEGEDGLILIQSLKEDCFLNRLPVVVYTRDEDHALARRALSLGAQNSLIKPYSDAAIHLEIAKVAANPWRNLHFEEEKSFCAQMGLKHEELKQMRRSLAATLEQAAAPFVSCGERKDLAGIAAQVASLSDAAQAAGVWGAFDCLQSLQQKAEAGRWDALKRCGEDLHYASRFIHSHLDPGVVPEALKSEHELANERDAAERALWMGSDVKSTGPIVQPETVMRHLDALPACPVIDTVAAAFAMAVEKRSSNLNHVMDLVARDPALAAQVLISANQLDRESIALVEDPRVAVSLLGSNRLSSMAKLVPAIPERQMYLPPITWANFWLFQMGVARLADFAARYLQFERLAGTAFTAGLLHDLGKLLLLRVYPYGFHAMVDYAKRESVPLHEAEKKYIACTSREMGYHFAARQGLPQAYLNVIRWAEEPQTATEDSDLVAVVSLARDVCLHSHVGYCGDTPKDYCPPTEETAAWQVLQYRVFTGFNLRRFEAQARALCDETKHELTGAALS